MRTYHEAVSYLHRNPKDRIQLAAHLLIDSDVKKIVDFASTVHTNVAFSFGKPEFLESHFIHVMLSAFSFKQLLQLYHALALVAADLNQNSLRSERHKDAQNPNLLPPPHIVAQPKRPIQHLPPVQTLIRKLPAKRNRNRDRQQKLMKIQMKMMTTTSVSRI